MSPVMILFTGHHSTFSNATFDNKMTSILLLLNRRVLCLDCQNCK